MKYPTNNRNVETLKSLISVLPEKPGIYQFIDSTEKIIYIGKAKNLKNRVTSYFSNFHLQKKTALLVRNIKDIRYTVLDTEQDALLLENNLIKKYQPRYNIRLKDDKTYPWICVKNENFPRVIKTRNVNKDGSNYYGPFTSETTLEILLDLIKTNYKIRNCSYLLSPEVIKSKKVRLCLEYYVGKCAGPCESLITESEYKLFLVEIEDILKGNISNVTKNIRRSMKMYAGEYRYEEAQKLKLKLHQLEKYQHRSTVVNPKIDNIDIFSYIEDDQWIFINYLKVIKGAIVQTHTIELKKHIEERKEEVLISAIVEIRQKFFSNSKEIIIPFNINIKLNDIKFIIPKKGDKKHLLDLSLKNAIAYKIDKERHAISINPELRRERILEKIKKDLHLNKIPQRIECFDNSNLFGTNPVAACVVFINAQPAPKEYRYFNIKTIEGPDDYGSMEEVVFRRYKRMNEEGKQLPQLVIIDGGKGQLNAALSAIDKLGLRGDVAVIGIAKKLEELYFAGDKVPLYLDKNSETLIIIQRIRDEAHRFGLKFHKLKRSSGFINSDLSNINGIGEKTIQKLLINYKSINKIRESSFEEIALEIGNSKARLIRNYFEKQKFNEKKDNNKIK